jgi:hypothetical protein
MGAVNVVPAKGHPARSRFVETPKAGISGRKDTVLLPEAPAFAGVTGKRRA